MSDQPAVDDTFHARPPHTDVPIPGEPEGSARCRAPRTPARGSST